MYIFQVNDDAWEGSVRLECTSSPILSSKMYSPAKILGCRKSCCVILDKVVDVS